MLGSLRGSAFPELRSRELTMYIRRLSVSPEAIQRAIRGRLVSEHGAGTRYAVMPLPIHAAASEDPHGVNWQLAPAIEGASTEAEAAARAAAAQVAAELNLSA